MSVRKLGENAEVTVVTDELRDDYSKIFERLVQSGEGEFLLLGYVAYALYKVAKRDWVKQQLARTGTRPTDAELKQYASTWTDTRLDGLKTESNQVLTGFASYIVDQERPKILKEALAHRSFFREASVACCGALFYTVVLIFFAFILRYFDIDALAIFHRVGVEQTHVTEPVSSTPSISGSPGAATPPRSP